MTSLLTALSRIDPAAGLVKYVTDVKPFHTKILDIQIEYVYQDSAIGSASDSFHTLLDQFSLKPDVTYACGYGNAWDSGDGGSEYYAILRATSPTEGDDESNSFVIPTPAVSEYGFFVYNEDASTLKLSTSYSITAANATSKTFTVSGDITSLISTGDKIGVNVTLQNGDVRNTIYTVSSSVLSVGNTIITVLELVPNQLTLPGTLSVFLGSAAVPAWMLKPTKVSVRSTGNIPLPISGSDEYYIVPGTTDGEFSLAKRRYPQDWFDYVNLSTVGTGQLFVKRAELFQPSDKFTVSGSTLNRNDGPYTVKYTIQTVSTITVYVNEPIQLTTPTGSAFDGAMYMGVSSGYDDTEDCELATAPDLYARGRTYERLTFDFDVVLRSSADGIAVENPPVGGYSVGEYSGGSVGYDEVATNYRATSIPTAPSLTLTPAGFDTIYFDVSSFDMDDIQR